MAQWCVITKATLVPGGVITDARWRYHGKDDAFCFLKQLVCKVCVDINALDVKVIVVLVHRQVHGPCNAHQVDINLHLDKVLRFAVTDLLGYQVAEALVGVGLELQHMPGLGRFQQSDGHPAKRATEMTATHYLGEHQGIVSQEIWDRVHEHLQNGDRKQKGPHAVCASDGGRMNEQQTPGFTTYISMKFRIRGGKTVMMLPDGTRAIERKEVIVDTTMVKIIARGHRWHRLLSGGSFNTIEDLAAAEKISPSYVSRVTRLAFLAPGIIEAILDGKQPAHLTMKGLLAPCPAEWSQQQSHFAEIHQHGPMVQLLRKE